MAIARILIVIVGFLLAISLGVAILVWRIKRQAIQISQELLGTDDLMDGFKLIEEEYASTPKSISAMTSLYLPKIAKDFPQFEYYEMRGRAENVLNSYLEAIDEHRTEILQDANEQLRRKLEDYLLAMDDAGKREHFEQKKVHQIEIADYQKRNGRCIITFQAAIQYYYYVLDKNETIIAGSKDRLTQAKYNIDMIYIQNQEQVDNGFDLSLGINCPNCGAPISGLGSKICEYCGTPVVELNIHAWSFSDIRN